jgi:hypothetical protein
MALDSFSPRLLLAPLAVLSPGSRLAGTPSRGNGKEGLKRLYRFRSSDVCRQPVLPGMPVVGAQVAADGSGWQQMALPGAVSTALSPRATQPTKKSGEGRMAGTPSRGNGNEGLKRLSRFRGSGVRRQPVAPGMPVVGAQVAAYCSLLQFLGRSRPPSRRARRNLQRILERAEARFSVLVTLASRPRSARRPKTECAHSLVLLTAYYTQYAHFVKSRAQLQQWNSIGTLGLLST